jgi:hypothetical protein
MRCHNFLFFIDTVRDIQIAFNSEPLFFGLRLSHLGSIIPSNNVTKVKQT